jgi:hypothetical protein
MPADRVRIEVALQVLDQLGVTVADLQGEAGQRRPVPSMGEYLPLVEAAAGPGARRTYRPYWRHLHEAFGDLALDEITATDIEALQRHLAGSAVARRNGRGGRYSGEH